MALKIVSMEENTIQISLNKKIIYIKQCSGKN